MAYPVSFDIDPPERFEKPHVVIRALVILVLLLPAVSVGWILGLVYLSLPVAAAVLVSQKGAQRYLEESETDVTRWLRYVIALYAYMGFLTDRFINQEPAETFDLRIQTSGTPTPGSALMRIIFGIPHAIALVVLGLAFIVVVPVAAFSIFVDERVPDWAYNYTRGWMRWNARLFAYMASLVDEYPPFSLENGEVIAAATPAPAPPPPPADPTPPAAPQA